MDVFEIALENILSALDRGIDTTKSDWQIIFGELFKGAVSDAEKRVSRAVSALW